MGILKARHDSQQATLTETTIITQETEHDDVNTMTDHGLRCLFSKLAKKCGEAVHTSVLKVKHRNVLIAAITDRRDTIAKAMDDVVAPTIHASDDSAFASDDQYDSDNDSGSESESSSEDESKTNCENEPTDCDTQDESGMNDGYYEDVQDPSTSTATNNNSSNNASPPDDTTSSDNTSLVDASTTHSSSTVANISTTTNTSTPANAPVTTTNNVSNPSSTTSTDKGEDKPPDRVKLPEDRSTFVGTLFRGVNIADHTPDPSFQVRPLNVK